MRTTYILLTLGLLILVPATPVFGDIARPQASPTGEVKIVLNTGMEIVPDSKAWKARLQISEETLKELREGVHAGTTSQSFGARITRSSTNTIVAGLFLFLSVSFGGVWLARSSKGRSQKALAAILISVATLGTAALIAQANAGPPPSYFWRNLSKNLNAGKPTNGGVEIEIVPEGVGVKLIVPTRNSGNPTDD